MIDRKQTKANALLKAWRQGDLNARDSLFDHLYADLRQISAALLRGESNSSLSTGDLVNEAVLRLIRLEQIDWNDKAHFLALAAKAMRRALIDHARKKSSDKRRHEKITLVTRIAGGGVERLELDVLEKSLIRLGVIEPDLAEIVELRYFGGMTLEDISEYKSTSPSTVKRNWRVARAWLLESMNGSLIDD